MINWIKGIHHPEAYHGINSRPPFFEGWYHKIVTKSGHPFAIIPGIYRSAKVENNFPFVMIFDGQSGDVHFERFNINDFSAKTDRYSVSIGENKFFTKGLALKINSQNLSIEGSLSFSKNIPWPVTLAEPGCMGWYSYMPFMECYHGILSMHHDISGELAYNNRVIDFSKGTGYTEKDWGKNFPNSWIWVQANHFNKSKISISASIASIPFLGTQFAGFIIGLLVEDKLYRFTTYRSAKTVKLKHDRKAIDWIVKQKDLTLSIYIELGNKAGLLFAPDENDMIEKVPEYLDSKVSIRLQDSNKIIIEDESYLAASEVIGDIYNLLELANKH
jgi:hypothetical protein